LVQLGLHVLHFLAQVLELFLTANARLLGSLRGLRGGDIHRRVFHAFFLGSSTTRSPVHGQWKLLRFRVSEQIVQVVEPRSFSHVVGVGSFRLHQVGAISQPKVANERQELIQFGDVVSNSDLHFHRALLR